VWLQLLYFIIIPSSYSAFVPRWTSCLLFRWQSATTELWCPVHTTGMNNTRLSCLVCVGSMNGIGDKSRLLATENFKLNMFSFVQFCPLWKWDVNSFVSSWPSFQFAPRSFGNLFANAFTPQIGLDKTVRSPIYWGLLKTVGDCRRVCSNNGQDKTVLSVSLVWTRHQLPSDGSLYQRHSCTVVYFCHCMYSRI